MKFYFFLTKFIISHQWQYDTVYSNEKENMAIFDLLEKNFQRVEEQLILFCLYSWKIHLHFNEIQI